MWYDYSSCFVEDFRALRFKHTPDQSQVELLFSCDENLSTETKQHVETTLTTDRMAPACHTQCLSSFLIVLTDQLWLFTILYSINVSIQALHSNGSVI